MGTISLLPLLAAQRSIYALPAGRGRFEHYLSAMIGGTDDVALPLSAFNPMGKPHVATTLDALLGFDAEAVAARAIDEAMRRLGDIGPDFRVGLVVADDVGGGWTNRQFTDLANRFRPDSDLKRGWAVSLLWTGDAHDPESTRRAVLATISRTLYIRRHGFAETLRDRMRQEGLVAAFSGFAGPSLDADDLAYSREVISGHLDATDIPTVLACLYGDAAALAVGQTPLGLSPNAGYAVAWEEHRGWAEA